MRGRLLEDRYQFLCGYMLDVLRSDKLRLYLPRLGPVIRTLVVVVMVMFGAGVMNMQIVIE